MKIKKSNLNEWTGVYKGVAFEIHNWSNKWGGKENWTYYLILFLSRIPEENNPKSYWLRGKKTGSFMSYKEYNHPVISRITFHGGCTWYSKVKGFDGDEKVIKIGCDYGHYYDENRDYDLERVKYDVRNTIDSFLEFVPNYKYWCCGNGKLYDLKDGVVKEGQFYSLEYYGEEKIKSLSQ